MRGGVSILFNRPRPRSRPRPRLLLDLYRLRFSQIPNRFWLRRFKDRGRGRLKKKDRRREPGGTGQKLTKPGGTGQISSFHYPTYNAGSRRSAARRSAPRVEPCYGEIPLHFLRANCYTKKLGLAEAG